ncbi:MAG: SRPBCC domain-containing protein [Bacteroidetes bacterium]|nr:SRPBCC domain-containing protein [Bacteroidota bacterium]
MNYPQQYKLEYAVRSSPKILYNLFSTSHGLALWFADRVTDRNKIFTFYWNDSSKQAKMVIAKPCEFVRFQWLDEPESKTFEFRVSVDEVTNDVALIITDFADSKNELKESKMLWDNLVHTLKHQLGVS